MARFYPVYVRRSDGKIELAAKGKRKEINQPTEEQLDQKPDKNGISDFYREVDPTETKHLDWRRKLGGMLARELDWKDKSGGDNGYILVTFPENYHLYEHVKKTVKDGKLEVKSKTHAAGGNDRQDAYLYGHPAGRKKRFRSPNDFFPHLLWLCTDESGDTDNCTCKICCPEDLETVAPGMKVKPEKGIKSESTLPAHVRQANVSVPRQQEVQAQVPRLPSSHLTPTPLPPKRSQDQIIDSQYNSYIYRPGELAWFKRGQAWGLGAVLRRWKNNTLTCYNVQPLSHPYNHPQATVKQSVDDMRPWLAWSVPKFTNANLNDLPQPPRYDTMDWQGLMSKRYGNGDTEVDASILAAKMVDATYTPFGKLQTTQPESDIYETHFDGIFLGAEKIWTGDPVRLQTGSGTEIMVVHSIVEHKRVSAMAANQVIQQSTHLVGDVYQLAHVHHNNPSLPTPAAPNNNPHLPERLTRDLLDRNKRSVEQRRVASFWKIVSSMQRVDLNDIKGRWYEATILLPILHPDQWRQSWQQGDIQEATLFMNSRGDSLNSNRAPHLPRVPRENVRLETREEAFSKAAPPGTKIIEGTQPPASDNVGELINIDRKFDTADDENITVTNANRDTLADFVMLDDMDHAPVEGFGQAYGNQGSGYY